MEQVQYAGVKWDGAFSRAKPSIVMPDDRILAPWDDRFLLGMPVIDFQHKKMLEYINRIYVAGRTRKDPKRDGFKSTVFTMLEYSKLHFSTEEDLMGRFEYSMLNEHRKEHIKFIKDTMKGVDELKGKEKDHDAMDMFVEFMKDWFLDHVVSLDKEMTDHALASGKILVLGRTAETSGVVQWNDSYGTGISMIDSRNKMLLDLLNDLYTLCRSGSTVIEASFSDAAHSLMELIIKHFTAEEKLMEKVSYPQMEEHIAEHRELAREFLLDVKTFEKDEQGVVAVHDLKLFLKGWFQNHVTQTDRRMSKYIFDLARSGELDSILKNEKQAEPVPEGVALSSAVQTG
jgi:hemerythrin